MIAALIGADRDARDRVGLDPCFVERFVDPGLIGAERATPP